MVLHQPTYLSNASSISPDAPALKYSAWLETLAEITMVYLFSLAFLVRVLKSARQDLICCQLPFKRSTEFCFTDPRLIDLLEHTFHSSAL